MPQLSEGVPYENCLKHVLGLKVVVDIVQIQLVIFKSLSTDLRSNCMTSTLEGRDLNGCCVTFIFLCHQI